MTEKNTAVVVEQPKAVSPMEMVRRELNAMATQFVAALPPHIGPEKFIRVVLTALQKAPDLLKADRRSLFGAAMAAAQDGLLPDGREGAIVPFKGQAQWMPMTKGLLKLARNSGELASIASEVIYSADKFRYWVDSDGPKLEHEPALFAEDRGEMIGVYALAKTKDGDLYVEAMNRAQVEKIRDVSRAKGGPAWSQWYDEMARKSVIRRLAKRLPMSTDLEKAFERDNDNFDLNQQPEEKKLTGSRLKNIVSAKAVPVSAEPSEEVVHEVTEVPTVAEAPANAEEAAAAAVDKL